MDRFQVPESPKKAEPSNGSAQIIDFFLDTKVFLAQTRYEYVVTWASRNIPSGSFRDTSEQPTPTVIALKNSSIPYPQSAGSLIGWMVALNSIVVDSLINAFVPNLNSICQSNHNFSNFSHEIHTNIMIMLVMASKIVDICWIYRCIIDQKFARLIYAERSRDLCRIVYTMPGCYNPSRNSHISLDHIIIGRTKKKTTNVFRVSITYHWAKLHRMWTL